MLGGKGSPSARAARWFPVVGLGLGALVGGIWWSLRHWLDPLPAAAVLVGLDLALTGMLHFDGLADAGDGLLAPMDRARRMEVMRDPHIGAFGAVTVGAVLLLRWSALSSLVALPLLVTGLWCLSRSGMTLALVVLPYARSEGGLASAFGGDQDDRDGGLVSAGIIGLLVGAAAITLARPAGSFIEGAAATAAGVVGFGIVIALGHRRLGGYTGDVLGAAGVVGETLGLVVAGAHW